MVIGASVLGPTVLGPTANQVSAAGGTSGATGLSGATYNLTVTCATGSATAQVSLRTAARFHGFDLIDNAGKQAPAVRYTEQDQPGVSGPQDWVAATFLGTDADSYRIEEVSLDGVRTPVVGPVPTTDCPTYSGPGSAFQALTPTRILDTRAESALNYSGPKPVASSSVELQVTRRAGVPADATAVAVNITMTDTTQPGFVQAFPTGLATPGTSSSINAGEARQSIANTVIVPVGIGGNVTLFTSGGTHLVVDISGFFTRATGPVRAGRFVGVVPKRVLDTRVGSPLNFTGATPARGTTVRVNPVTAAGLPAGRVSAVAINVTATEAAGLGYVQVAPAGQLVPGANSNLNLTRAGQTIPNMVIVPVSAAGEIDLFTSGGTNLIVDVLGWFTNPTADPSLTGLYVAVVPERVLDTRPDSAVNHLAERRPVLGETSKPGIAGSVDVRFDGLPAGQVGAVLLNLTATEATNPGYVQATAQFGLTPGASSNVNVERSGQTIANAAIVPVNDTASITVYTQSGTNLIADIGGFFRT